MNYKEAIDKYIDFLSVSILIRHKGELYTASYMNFDKGVCGCCEAEVPYNDSEIQVVKVVDLSTLEVLYTEQPWRC